MSNRHLLRSIFILAIVLRKYADPNGQHKMIIQQLIRHVMKLLSIYCNVLNNKRPVFIPKGQKTDLFVNSRELQLINSYGYFGNDYFYLKIYKIVRIIYENYKVNCTGNKTMLLNFQHPYRSISFSFFFFLFVLDYNQRRNRCQTIFSTKCMP